MTKFNIFCLYHSEKERGIFMIDDGKIDMLLKSARVEVSAGFVERVLAKIGEDEMRRRRVDGLCDGLLRKNGVEASTGFTGRVLNAVKFGGKSTVSRFVMFGSSVAAAACIAAIVAVMPVNNEVSVDEAYFAQLDNLDNEISNLAALISEQELFSLLSF